MKLLAALTLALALLGCTDPTMEPDEAPQAESVFPPSPTDLEELSVRCADGDVLACDELYMQSRIDSDYERQAEPLATLLFAWDLAPFDEQEMTCSIWYSMTPGQFADEYLTGWNRAAAEDGLTHNHIIDFFSWACNRADV